MSYFTICSTIFSLCFHMFLMFPDEKSPISSFSHRFRTISQFFPWFFPNFLHPRVEVRWFPATGPPRGAQGQAGTFTADRQAAADGKLMQRRITHHLDGAGIPWEFTYWSIIDILLIYGLYMLINGQ